MLLVYKDDIEFKIKETKNSEQRITERQILIRMSRNCRPIEIHKSVLNKIMTTHK